MRIALPWVLEWADHVTAVLANLPHEYVEEGARRFARHADRVLGCA